MNLLHAQDAFMFGSEKFKKWEADFEARWNEPEARLAADLWNRQPDHIKQLARPMMDPDLLNILEGTDGN